jgi:DNA processing protein
LRSYRVGLSTFYRLLNEHGSAQAALAALPDIAARAGVERYVACTPDAAMQELQGGQRLGAKLVFRGEAGYPRLLADLSDAPPFFWALGNVSLLSRPMVALVGARNASSLGTRMAKRLAAELGEAGFVVVSGLARGVDAAAHQASLVSGTVAVQAGGVDVHYPIENAKLAEDIAQSGLRIAEQRIGLQPQARHFPMRNRIISGLCTGLVVVEAASRSGSLITARCALDQGREVMAVPGHPFDARAGGCNMLIRDGAHLVRTAEDVLEVLAQPNLFQAQPEPTAKEPDARPLQDAAKLHQRILDRLGPSPMAEDQLLRDLGQDAAAMAPALTSLELEGRITRQPGGLVARAS